MVEKIQHLVEIYEAKIEGVKEFIDMVYEVPGCEGDVRVGQAQIRAYMEIIEDLNGLR